jgi:site-specific DNA-methyltransferase (adenine-specific)
MAYLCRLVTPPNGLVLDPFMGSGSTGRGAVLEGFRFIGCELSESYIKIAAARIAEAEREVQAKAKRVDRIRLRRARFIGRLARQTS